MKYEYISYDVWGNEEDGYEVNQAFHTGRFIEFNPDLNDAEIIKALQEADIIDIDGVDVNQIRIDGDTGSLYFDYRGHPEFELRAVTEPATRGRG